MSALGISNAFRDAALLARAIVAGLGDRDSGPGGLDPALAGYRRQRDQAARPAYRLTAKIARLRPPGAGERLLYASLAGRPAEISRFFGALAGTEPLGHYFAPRNLIRVTASARRHRRARPGDPSSEDLTLLGEPAAER